MVSLPLIPSLSGPDFRDINFPEKWPLCSPAPGLLLADETPTCYRNSKQNTKYEVQDHLACGYNNLFLEVEGGSGLRTISVYGIPFPTGTTDQDNSYLREAAITIA